MTKTVLVVEDNDFVMKLYRSCLGSLGVTIVHTKNGDEALGLARSSQPAVVVMDIMLPGMSGIEVTRALKDDPATKAIPIVVVTTLAIAGDLDRIREAGADAYIAKPINVENFVNTIKAYLA
jgi:two-component system cell cycle response regulator DivK